MKKIIFLVLLLFVQAEVFSQENKLITTKSGLIYKFIEDRPGAKAKMGDLVVVHMKFKNNKDEFDSYKKGEPINIVLAPSFKGSLEEGLTYVSKGDSLELSILNDSLYTKLFKVSSLPEEIEPGSYTTFRVRVLEIHTKDQLEKEHKERTEKKLKDDMAIMEQVKKQILDSSQAQLKKDDLLLQDYLKKNKITAQKTENGIYFEVKKPGTGDKARPTDTVTVKYTGGLLDGKEFDKSTPESPLVFQLGIGEVIPGFEEPLAQLKSGSQATIYIPSSFAYGKQGIKSPEGEYIIPPNAPLIFDIEVLGVKKRK